MVTLERMRSLGVRRIPVTDDRGVLQGLLAFDDVLSIVVVLMNKLVGLVAQEIGIEVRTRP